MLSSMRATTSKLCHRRFSTLNASKLSPNVTRYDPTDAMGAMSRTSYRGPLQATIFDWSGTVADAHVLAPAVVFYELFAKHGVPITMKEVRGPMGLRKDLHIKKILEDPDVRQRWTDIKGSPPDESTVDLLFKEAVPMQLECLGRYTTLLPGIADTVDTLKGKYGHKIGATTGFTKVMVDILLADAAKQGYVPDSSVAGDQVENNMGFRPMPFMIYKNLVNLGVYPIESVIKVDDTVSGVVEGLNAGCWSIGVYAYSNYTDIDSLEQWEAMSETEQKERQEAARLKLEQSGAHYVIRSAADLPLVVDDINDRLARGEKPQGHPLLLQQAK